MCTVTAVFAVILPAASFWEMAMTALTLQAVGVFTSLLSTKKPFLNISALNANDKNQSCDQTTGIDATRINIKFDNSTIMLFHFYIVIRKSFEKTIMTCFTCCFIIIGYADICRTCSSFMQHKFSKCVCCTVIIVANTSDFDTPAYSANSEVFILPCSFMKLVSHYYIIFFMLRQRIICIGSSQYEVTPKV